MPVALRLYSRQGCHLCEDALQQLLALPCASDFTIEVTDIDADQQLQREYALRIPVLLDIELNHIIAEQGIDIPVFMDYLHRRGG